MAGSVESGVRADLAAWGISEPRLTLHHLAIALAAAIDTGDDERSTAALARELRLTMAAVEATSGKPPKDRLDVLRGES